jgi:outer membrane lipoprotein LolB
LKALLFATALALAGCALMPDAQGPGKAVQLASEGYIDRFLLDARVSVQAGERRYAGGLRWERHLPIETILLSTPLGQGVAEIRREGAMLVLTDADGRRQEAIDPDSLATKALGLPIPLGGLVHWLSGRPRPGAGHVAYLDTDGRVARIEQDGWRIDYDRYHEQGGLWLPGRLFASRDDGIEFRLVVDHWEMP